MGSEMCIRDRGQGRVVDIYLDVSRLGIYPPLFTSSSGDSCILILLPHECFLFCSVKQHGSDDVG